MKICDQMTAWFLLLILLFLKNYIDLRLSLDCDKKEYLWPNDSIILTFYFISSLRLVSFKTFVKELYWFNAKFRLWQNQHLLPNDCIILTFKCAKIIFLKISKAALYVICKANKWENEIIDIFVSAMTN